MKQTLPLLPDMAVRLPTLMEICGKWGHTNNAELNTNIFGMGF